MVNRLMWKGVLKNNSNSRISLSQLKNAFKKLISSGVIPQENKAIQNITKNNEILPVIENTKEKITVVNSN